MSQIPPDPLTLQPQEGSSPRTQRRKKKTRSKKPSTEPLEVVRWVRREVGGEEVGGEGGEGGKFEGRRWDGEKEGSWKGEGGGEGV